MNLASEYKNVNNSSDLININPLNGFNMSVNHYPPPPNNHHQNNHHHINNHMNLNVNNNAIDNGNVTVLSDDQLLDAMEAELRLAFKMVEELKQAAMAARYNHHNSSKVKQNKQRKAIDGNYNNRQNLRIGIHRNGVAVVDEIQGEQELGAEKAMATEFSNTPSGHHHHQSSISARNNNPNPFPSCSPYSSLTTPSPSKKMKTKQMTPCCVDGPDHPSTALPANPNSPDPKARMIGMMMMMQSSSGGGGCSTPVIAASSRPSSSSSSSSAPATTPAAPSSAAASSSASPSVPASANSSSRLSNLTVAQKLFDTRMQEAAGAAARPTASAATLNPDGLMLAVDKFLSSPDYF